MLFGTTDNEAFRWTETNGFELLGQLLLPNGGSTALAASADGSIVVGQAYFPRPQSSHDGFIWDAAHGMRSLTQYAQDLGFDLQGQAIEQANAISADGSIITGRAFGPLGGTVFALTIPEPGSAMILGVMFPILVARRRSIRAA